jgi:crooked neck
MYALCEELNECDVERTRQVYEECLKIIPHSSFSFSKIWILYSNFELRQSDLEKARKLLGTAIGKVPRNKLFRHYIELEVQLGQLDRVRRLYEKWLQYNATNTQVWLKYCALEVSLEEFDRARYLYNICIQQPLLDMPEVAWKAFIDFEVSQKQFVRARKLYEKLSDKTKHYKVCIAFAMFEANVVHDVERARSVFQNGYIELSGNSEGSSEELTSLLNTWKRFEEEHGTPATVDAVEDKINPNRKQSASKLLAKAKMYIERKRKLDEITPSTT